MARAMMSLTTSLGSPFSAESCARPVTSSRFMRQLPFSIFGFAERHAQGLVVSLAPAEPCLARLCLIQFASAPAPAAAAIGDKKSGVDPLSVPDAATGQAGRRAITISNGGNRLRPEEGWPPRRSYVRLLPMFEK